jgi:hypothetical protein
MVFWVVDGRNGKCIHVQQMLSDADLDLLSSVTNTSLFTKKNIIHQADHQLSYHHPPDIINHYSP